MSYVKAVLNADQLLSSILAGQATQQTNVDYVMGLMEREPKDVAKLDAISSGPIFSSDYLALKALEERVQETKDTDFADEGTGPSTVSSSDVSLTKAPKKINLKGKEEFIAELYPTAIEVSKETGVDPRIIVAQAALETGWGKHAPGNNYFGIKSHGMSGGQVLTTKEVVDGKTITIKDSFRSFESPRDSVRGYGEFIKANPRYREFSSANNLEDQVQALGRSGYATDPNYANKIYSIATGLPPISDFGEVSLTNPVKNPYKERRGR